MPKISINIPCFNASKYLGEMLDSIAEQTFQDYEVIIIDDNSDDDSYAILQKYAETDSRIFLQKNSVNMGIGYTRNRCIENSKGEYIAFMDADDIMPKYRLDHQYDFLCEHPECDVLFGGMELIDTEGKTVGEEYYGSLDSDTVKSKLFFFDVIPNGSAIVKTEFIRNKGLGFVEKNNESLYDYRFWTECVINGASFSCMDEVMELWRINPTGVTRKTVREKREMRKRIFDEIHQKYLNFYNINLTNKEKEVLFRFSCKEFGMGRKIKIKYYFIFKKMVKKLKYSVPELGEAFVMECDKLDDYYYGAKWLIG